MTGLNDLAASLLAASKLESALEASDRALLEIDDAVASHTYRVRGSILTALGRYEEAEPLLTRAVSLAANASEEGMALNLLGMLHRYAGDLERARDAYDRAMAIAIAQFGEESDAAATVWHNRGGLHHSAGEFVEAEAAARRAVEIRHRLHGPGHPDVVADLCALAGTLDGLERWRESEAIYVEALEFWELRVGPEHHEVAVVLNNLAGVYGATDRLAEAEAASRRSLAIKTALVGERHPDVALTMLNLATILYDRGRIDEGRTLAEQAATIVAAAPLSAVHPLRAHALAVCAQFHRPP